MVAVPSRGRADLQAPAPEAVATQELYERHGRQIYFFCLNRLRNPEEAEDATQTTFLNAFRGLQRGVAPEHEAAWLYKIAENVCLTRVRSSTRRRRVETPGDLEAVAEVVAAPESDTEEIRELPAALEAMPEQQRRALLLREWQGLSYREIADEMGLSQSAVEALLFRARRTLAQGLSEPPKRRRLSRLRAGGDAGWLAALLKMFVFSGGGKVALVGAVAASSAVGIAPGVRVALEDTLTPHMKSVSHHVAPAKPKPRLAPHVAAAAPVVVHTAPVVSHPAAPVVHRTRTKHVVVPRPVVQHGSGLALGRPAPVEPARPAPPAAQAPTAAPTDGTPTLQPTPAPSDTPAPAPAATAHDNGNGKDRGNAYGHKQDAPQSQPSDEPSGSTQPTTTTTVGQAPETQHGEGDSHANAHSSH